MSQKLPCQLDSLTEGALYLSEAILSNDLYKNQHTEVMEHILKLVQEMERKQRSDSLMFTRTIHLLKARSEIYRIRDPGDSPLIKLH
jgi:hypothetical protein